MNHWQIRVRAAAIPVALGIALTLWTARSYSGQSVVLVIASLALAGSSLWSCRALFGARAAWIFLACGVTLGWLAEQAGSSLGWFFGKYSYTDVLGPRVGDVPIVIPLMWFGLCHIGFVMSCLALWRQPAPPDSRWPAAALTAALAAMIVTAFDLGADPYFVYQLGAWIMDKKDGYWFGETIVGFAGWMVVGFAIVAAFQALARPRLAAQAPPVRAAAVPIAVYAGFIVFQLSVSQPVELRVIALFAMGIPALVAAAACRQWECRPAERAA